VIVHSCNDAWELSSAGYLTTQSPEPRPLSEPRPLVQRDWTPQEEEDARMAEEECKAIFHAYDLPPSNTITILGSVLAAAATNKCWVYDLHSTAPDAPDFKGSLLSCLINGLGHPSCDDAVTLGRKISYTILWQRVDVLDQVLNRTCIKDTHQRGEILQQALIEAIGRNDVRAVQRLLESGASVDNFEVDVKGRSKDREEIMRLVRKASKHTSALGNEGEMRQEEHENAISTHRSSWQKLMTLGKADSHTEYVRMITAEVKESFDKTDTFLPVSSLGSMLLCCFEKSRSAGQAWRSVNAQVEEQAIEPLVPEEQNQLYHVLSAQALLIKQDEEKAKGGSHSKNLLELKVTLPVGIHLLNCPY